MHYFKRKEVRPKSFTIFKFPLKLLRDIMYGKIRKKTRRD